MSDISKAKAQAKSIQAAINGSSSAMQVLGNIGRDPKPEVMLAVGLAHAMNAISALISAVEDLEDEVNALKRRVR